MRTYFIVAFVCVLAAAGFAAATLVTSARAGTVGLFDLSGLGYVVGVRMDLSQSPVCGNYWVLSGNGAPETLIGDPSDKAGCNTAQELQARIDQLLAQYPPPPPTVPTITVTLPGETVTLPAVTTTVAAPPSPPVTVTGPPVTMRETTTETVTAPAPPPVTVTSTVSDPRQAATIRTLRAKLAAANTRTGSRRRMSPRRRSPARPPTP